MDKKRNTDGTTHIKLGKCQIVGLYGHGYKSATNPTTYPPHTFQYPENGPSAAGFVGCWPGATNSNIRPDNRIGPVLPMDYDTHKPSDGGDEYLKEWIDGLAYNAIKTAKTSKFKNCCPVTIYITGTLDDGLLRVNDVEFFSPTVIMCYGPHSGLLETIQGDPKNF